MNTCIPTHIDSTTIISYTYFIMYLIHLSIINPFGARDAFQSELQTSVPFLLNSKGMYIIY